jgi:hypothetical protein
MTRPSHFLFSAHGNDDNEYYMLIVRLLVAIADAAGIGIGRDIAVA